MAHHGKPVAECKASMRLTASPTGWPWAASTSSGAALLLTGPWDGQTPDVRAVSLSLIPRRKMLADWKWRIRLLVALRCLRTPMSMLKSSDRCYKRLHDLALCEQEISGRYTYCSTTAESFNRAQNNARRKHCACSSTRQRVSQLQVSAL